MMRGERKHGRGVACGVASVVILLLATAAGSAQARGSAAPPATPLAAKQAARTALAGLLPARDKALDTLVRKADSSTRA